MFQRFKYICVGVRPPGKQQADHRHGALQVRKIQPAPQRVRRFPEIQDDNSSARLGHAHHFLQPRLPARQIPQAIPHRDRIKGVVRERKLLGVPLHEFDLATLHSWVLQSCLCHFEHLVTEVQAGDVRTLLRQGKSNVSRAAAQVQRPVTGLHIRQRDDTTLPQPVQAEALEVVQQVVTAGDGGKKVAHLLAALFTGNKEDISHASSVSASRQPVKAHKWPLQKKADFGMDLAGI